MDKYTHLELDQETRSISGGYTPLKEVRLKHNGRDVLYVIGEAITDTSCCGIAFLTYAIVPGYVNKWQGEVGETGLPVTEVEPISDSASRKVIREIIEKTENVSQVDFW